MKATHLLAAMAISTGTFAGAVQAQAPETPPALVITAENLMAGDERHTALAAKGGKATDLLPGDVLRYQLRYTNPRAEAVKNVVFSNPVPDGLRYVGSSASASVAEAAVAFSIDGGKSYSAQPMIEVVEEGKRRNVPAPAGMYTHVRWTVPGSVQSKAQVTAEFRAELADRPEPGKQP
jgi:uncharacterized repeat protein (TIGR01451 family)